MKNIISKFLVILTLSLGTLDPAAQDVSQQWVKTYSYLASGDNMPSTMTFDGNNNIFVSGWSSTENAADFCTVKYSPNGVQQWAVRYSGFEGQYNNDNIYASTKDYNNFIYVTGGSDNNGFSQGDIATIKYDQSGNEVWVRRYASVGLEDDAGYGIYVDANSNVFVTGSAKGHIIVIKYNSSGTELWKTIISDPADHRSFATEILTDGLGNIYVAGIRIHTGASSQETSLLIKFSNTGVLQWERSYQQSLFNQFTKLKRDLQGNIIVAGYSGYSTDYNMIVQKYAPDGELIWSKPYMNTNIHDYLTGMTVDYNNNVIITGYSSNKFITMKYNLQGDKLWSKTYLPPNYIKAEASSISFDGQGSTYITGTITSSSKNSIATVKYNAAGDEMWAKIYEHGNNISTKAKCIILDNMNNVIVAGYTQSPNLTSFCTVKYTPLSGIEVVGSEIPSKYELSQNYPNPFNPVTNINFSLPKGGNVKLVIFDIMGREIAELVNENLNAGTYKFDFDAGQLSSGTYFYKLTAADFSEVKKMILIK